MRILQVTQSYYPRPGGVTEHVHHITGELRRRGHDVTVLTANFTDDRSDEPGVVRVGRNVLVPVNGAWVNVTVGRNLRRKFSSVCAAVKPDIVHTHCPLAPTLPTIALTTAPVACRLVGTFHAAAVRNIGYQLFRNTFARLVQRLDTRIVVSDAALALAQSYFPGEYVVIPNGVDCSRFTPACEPLPEFLDDAFNVLYVGRMDKRKGLKYLFRAVSRASLQTSRRLRLIVVGDDGPRRHLLPRLPNDVELVLAGVVNRDVLPRYFVTGDVFCSPATERESFGIVLLEAMASGVPVIGTAIPGYLTVLRDRWNALVVPPRDPAAISRALVELIDSPALRRKLRTRALSFSRTYRWERIVDQLEAVYRGEDDSELSWRPVRYPAVGRTVPAQRA